MTSKRDRKLEQALKHELRKTGTPAAAPALRSSGEGGCVDAETLGAWTDGGLDAEQMAAVELHVSSCARCQAIVATAARSAPVIAPVISERAFRFPKWAIAPLAAAAAITIWMVVPQDTVQAPPARDAASQAPAKESGAATGPAPTVAAAEKFEGARQRANAAPRPSEVRPQRAEERMAEAAGAVAASPPPPAAPPAAADAVLQKSARLAVTPLEILSPDPSIRWRVVNNSIERSEDAGASWVPIRAPGGESLTGGVSPSRSVCWLIGSSGLVMVTADGMAFTRVPLPERADLATINATDARSATVTTSDGRRFRTDDSGRTWRQIQAQ